MKRLLFTLVVLMGSVLLFAQESSAQEGKDVTKFLGIPIDGTKYEMIAKLKEKGFVSNAYYPNVLEGEFNGHDVKLHIVTNNNKVCRIMVENNNLLSETDIRIRFNSLIEQFMKNGNYMVRLANVISVDENISYEISVNKKRYEAAFFQTSLRKRFEQDTTFLTTYINLSDEDKDEFIKLELDKATKRSVWFMIDESYGKYKILMYYDNCYNQANGEDL